MSVQPILKFDDPNGIVAQPKDVQSFAISQSNLQLFTVNEFRHIVVTLMKKKLMQRIKGAQAKFF